MSSSTKTAGTGANATGIGTYSWANPTVITANDLYEADSYCPTQYLKATNFGFSIPSDAIIEGIVVGIERRCIYSNSALDATVKLVKNNVIVGTNNASSAYWPSSSTVASYGSSSDLWGETWTYSDINSSNFGVVTSASGSPVNHVYVDYISITVYYSVLVQMQSTIAQIATVASELTRELRFATSMSQVASLVVNLTAYANFKAAISQIATVIPNLKVTQNFQAAIAQVSAVAAVLKPRIRIATAIAQQVTVAPALRVGVRIKTAISQLSTVTARLLISWSRKQPYNSTWTDKSNPNNTWTNK